MADNIEHGLNYQQGIESSSPYRVNASFSCGGDCLEKRWVGSTVKSEHSLLQPDVNNQKHIQ